MTTVLLYALVTTTLYYLGSRAQITRVLWSRYPPWLDRLALCAACSGWWYGLAIGCWGYWRQVPFGPLPGDRVDTVIGIGLASAAWTAILAAIHVRALTELGAEGEDPDAALSLSQPQGSLLGDTGPRGARDDLRDPP